MENLFKGVTVMDKKKILIIDDEINIIELITMNLERNGFEVISCLTGEEGIRLVKEQKPDLILLDLMLPGISGVEVCKRVQSDSETKNIPIIMLTAKANESDKIIGLEIGADDYITKPFSVRELVARVKALLRLVEKHSVDLKSEGDNSIVIGNLSIDVEKFLVQKDEVKIDLTAKEFAMLSLLALNRDIIYSREDLLEKLADEDSSSVPRSIDVHMTNLRKKIGKDNNGQDFIKTVRGKGYRINL
jgi:two-component system alkaline phosphatase synthesis response regulator PhoP